MNIYNKLVKTTNIEKKS